jgi:predicted aldo/keto reductase-like oxidoreductase
MGCSWDKVALGRTGLQVAPLGLASSFGVGERDVERAFERGLNYFYWGSLRKPGFGAGVRNLAPAHREKMVVVVQSYTRVAMLMRPSLELALRRLRIGYADLLLLGWWNEAPPRRILDAALALKAAGKVKHVMISCHQREQFRHYFQDPAYQAVMVRYNASHPGAEQDVFPFLPAQARPGVIAYTATRWGGLLDPKLQPANEPRPRASDCYRFALSNPNVDVVLAGPRNAVDLDEAMSALDRGPMAPDELAWMKRVGAHVKRSVGPVGSGTPLHVADAVSNFLWHQ